MSDCDCCTLIYEAEAGTRIVQREDSTDYELVMPSGNRNIWFTDKEDAIYCASVVGSCWLEAEACGAIEERAQINAAAVKVANGDGFMAMQDFDEDGNPIDAWAIHERSFTGEGDNLKEIWPVVATGATFSEAISAAALESEGA